MGRCGLLLFRGAREMAHGVCACVSNSSSSSGVAAVRYAGNSRLPDPPTVARLVLFIQEFGVDFAVESSPCSPVHRALLLPRRTILK